MAEPQGSAEKTSEGSVAESAPECRQLPAWIAGKMTPVLQVTDTEFAFLFKRVATELAAVEEPPKAVTTEEQVVRVLRVCSHCATEHTGEQGKRMRAQSSLEGEQGFQF